MQVYLRLLRVCISKKINGISICIKLAMDDFRPHHVCTYLYELVGEFSTFTMQIESVL